MGVVLGFFLFWFAMASLAAAIASGKGRSWFGFFVYGFLVWPVALIHALVMQPAAPTEAQQLAAGDQRKCPHCAELIKSEAKVCKHCGRDVEPALVPPPSRPCPHCGVINATQKLICRNCRRDIDPWKPDTPANTDQVVL